jgi:lipopolysaccharide export system protein LptA
MISHRVSSVLSFACVAMVLCLGVASSACAEKADKEKNINFAADDATAINQVSRTGALKGNVVITQGTLTIKADRIDFKQNDDNSLSATAYGNPVAFRQKKDDSDEYYEGFAQRAVYDGSKDLLELFDRALLKGGPVAEIRSNYVSYNSKTGVANAEGRPDAPGVGVGDGPGAKVRGVFPPRSDSPLGKDATKDKDGKGKSVESKDKAADSKDKSGDAKDKAAATKASSPEKAPLALKPAEEPSKPQ